MAEADTIRIQPLTQTPLEAIHQAFIHAFEDYAEPVKPSLAELGYMLQRRGYDPALSLGAFDKNRLAGFILNGSGEWNGKRTAYDTGTGLIKAYRRQGIATRLFQESLPLLRRNGVRQVLLEVIRTNIQAFDLYRKLGFDILREFHYYISPVPQAAMETQAQTGSFRVREVKKPDWDLFRTFWDFQPSWQNSIESLRRVNRSLTVLAADDSGKIAAYGILERHTGDIPQLAVHRDCRGRGLGALLLGNLMKRSETGQIRIINIPTNYEPMHRLLQDSGLKPGAGQFEMMLALQ